MSSDSELAFEQEVSRIIKIEIPHWWQNQGTNFTSQLLSLIQKADPNNRYKLSKVYPAEVEAFKRWDKDRWSGEPSELAREQGKKTFYTRRTNRI